MPSRGWRSSASSSRASSGIERPIVPPAPAQFSISSQVSPSALGEHPLERRRRRARARLEAGAEVRADVEDDRVGLDRLGGLERRDERADRALETCSSARGEVAEVERVADDPADPRLARGAP